MSAVFRLLKPVALPFLLITAGMLGLTLLPALPRASPASFTLFGRIMSPAGWGFTSTTVTSPGPDLTVLPGETVTLSLTSGDGFTHNWGVDYNGNGVPDPGEPLSSNFASTAPPYTFTATTTPGTYTYWCYIHKGPMFGRFIVQSPAVPDFSISASAATPASFVGGNSATSTITLTSLNSFAGNVNLAASTTAPVTGLTFSFSPNPVPLMAGGTGTSTLAISTTTSTPVGTYTITATGMSGSLSHPASLTVMVLGPDFSISASPAALRIVQGSSGTSTITLSSLNGFSGTVSLTSKLSSAGPQVTFSPSSVAVSSSGPTSSTVTVSTASSGAYSTPVSQGNYNVTVIGTSGSLVHSATLALTVGSSSGVGALPSAAIIGGGIAAAIAVVAGTVYVLRRRSKTKT